MPKCKLRKKMFQKACRKQSSKEDIMYSQGIKGKSKNPFVIEAKTYGPTLSMLQRQSIIPGRRNEQKTLHIFTFLLPM